MGNDATYKMATVLINSEYSMVATGFRNVDTYELACIIQILRSNNPDLAEKKLNDLYESHPQTIALNKNIQSSQCDGYNENCNCFLPGVPREKYNCQVERQKKIEESDQRNYPEYTAWRTSVFERDNYTCLSCSQVGGELNAHHIKPYATFPELRLSIENGITLCHSCHKKAHQKEA